MARGGLIAAAPAETSNEVQRRALSHLRRCERGVVLQLLAPKEDTLTLHWPVASEEELALEVGYGVGRVDTEQGASVVRRNKDLV